MSARPLALFRIALGTLLLVEVAQIWPSLAELHGPTGFLQSNLLTVVTGGWLPPVATIAAKLGTSPLLLLQALVLFEAACLVLFVSGLFTRAATVGVWAAHTFFMNSNFLSIYGIDRYFHLFLFISIFLPLGATWSIDEKRRGEGAPPASREFAGALRFLQLALLLTYLQAGVAKMGGHDWWSGDAIWRAVNVPEFTQMNLLWLADYPVLVRVMCWGTIVLETGYILAVWIRPLRMPWILGILSLHVGIALFMGLHLFALSLIVLNAVLFLNVSEPSDGPRLLRRFAPRNETLPCAYGLTQSPTGFAPGSFPTHTGSR